MRVVNWLKDWQRLSSTTGVLTTDMCPRAMHGPYGQPTAGQPEASASRGLANLEQRRCVHELKTLGGSWQRGSGAGGHMLDDFVCCACCAQVTFAAHLLTQLYGAVVELASLHLPSHASLSLKRVCCRKSRNATMEYSSETARCTRK